jgi:hypothetical protein
MTNSAQRIAASAFLAAMAVLTIVVGACAAEPTQLSYASSDEAVAALVAAAGRTTPPCCARYSALAARP